MPQAAPSSSVRKAWPPSFSTRVILPRSTPISSKKLHYGPGYRRVPGEEVDVVVLEVVKRVDVAGCGQLLRALDRGGRIGLAPVGLHAAVERLCRVLGHGGRPEGEGLGRSAF